MCSKRIVILSIILAVIGTITAGCSSGAARLELVEQNHKYLMKLAELQGKYCAEGPNEARRAVLVAFISAKLPGYPTEGICDQRFVDLLNQVPITEENKVLEEINITE